MLAIAQPRRLSCPVNEGNEASCDLPIVALCLPTDSRGVTGAQCESIATIRDLWRRRAAARDDLRTGRADQEQSPRASGPARRMEDGRYNQFATATGESSGNSADRLTS